MKYGTFRMMIGIPGSGKSTFARELKERRKEYLRIHQSNVEDVILSSDSIREELYGDEGDLRNHNEVFDIMFKRTKEELEKGNNVIYDATNLSSKKRTNLIKRLKESPYIRENVYFMCTMLVADREMCIKRDSERKRTIGTECINRMYKNVQVPMKFEGWDNIEYKLVDREFGELFVGANSIYTYQHYVDYILKRTKVGQKCIDLAQDSSYHTFSVSRHMFYAFENARMYTDDNNVLLAVLLHDIGKPYCKNFKPNSRYANFYCHENVSAYETLGILLQTGLVEDDIQEITTYIQLHTRLMNSCDSYKAKEKLYNNLGKEMFDNLVLIYNADTSAK